MAEFRSITAAATHLEMRTATASAALKRVESTLGIELFSTTRLLRLSSAGEKYIPISRVITGGRRAAGKEKQSAGTDQN